MIVSSLVWVVLRRINLTEPRQQMNKRANAFPGKEGRAEKGHGATPVYGWDWVFMPWIA
jgi:hypothetical protein